MWLRTEALSGSWSKSGDRRRIVFADGNSAVEEILEIAPQRFRYEVWNLTNDTGGSSPMRLRVHYF